MLSPVLREVEFVYRHRGCWLQETSEVFPEIVVTMTTLYKVGTRLHMDVTVHTPDQDTLRRVEQRWSNDQRLEGVVPLYVGPHGGRFQVAYGQQYSLYDLFFKHAPVSIVGAKVTGGREYYHLIGSQEAITQTLQEVAKAGEIEIQSSHQRGPTTRENDAGSHLGFLATLTDRQLGLLTVATTEGYFRWPRRISATALAAELGVSGSSLLQHLRHAEEKVFDALLRDLQQRDRPRYEALLARFGVKSKRPSAKQENKG